MNGCSLNNPQNTIKTGCKDRNNDGKPDFWAYQPDIDTLIVKVDENYDGNPDSCDKQRKINSKVIYETDIDCDGLIESWSEEYNGTETIFMDTNRDGVFDFKGYSKNKILLKVELDLNYDGKMDAFKIYDNGTLLYCEIDTDHDGTIDKVIYNSNEFNFWKMNTYPDYTINFSRLNERVKIDLK